jgi:hypothetical protein
MSTFLVVPPYESDLSCAPFSDPLGDDELSTNLDSICKYARTVPGSGTPEVDRVGILVGHIVHKGTVFSLNECLPADSFFNLFRLRFQLGTKPLNNTYREIGLPVSVESSILVVLTTKSKT